ncbi:MAG: hypothetical protein KJP07_08115, partial [Desulfatitalea sp.]|nr:hypothetical protein [Desulfatitalea sp.]
TIPDDDGTIPDDDGTIPDDDGTIPDGDGTIPDDDGAIPDGNGNGGDDTGDDDLRCEDLKHLWLKHLLFKHFHLRHHRRPALLARVHATHYKPRHAKLVNDIVVFKLNTLAHIMAASHKIKLIYSPDVVDRIAAHCTEAETGVCKPECNMSGTIMSRIPQALLDCMGRGEMPSIVNLDLDASGDFNVTFGNQ